VLIPADSPHHPPRRTTLFSISRVSGAIIYDHQRLSGIKSITWAQLHLRYHRHSQQLVQGGASRGSVHQHSQTETTAMTAPETSLTQIQKDHDHFSAICVSRQCQTADLELEQEQLRTAPAPAPESCFCPRVRTCLDCPGREWPLHGVRLRLWVQVQVLA